MTPKVAILLLLRGRLAAVAIVGHLLICRSRLMRSKGWGIIKGRWGKTSKRISRSQIVLHLIVFSARIIPREDVRDVKACH